MTTDQITVRFSKRGRNVFIGKCFVVLLASYFGGLAMTATDRKHVERASTLTLQQYTSEFDQYKADLVKDVQPLAVNALGLLIVLVVGFVVYEGFGIAFGWLLTRVTNTMVGEHGGDVGPPRPGAA
jgi:hypothetical protein